MTLRERWLAAEIADLVQAKAILDARWLEAPSRDVPIELRAVDKAIAAARKELDA